MTRRPALRLFTLLVISGAFSPALSGQEVTDTVRVTITGTIVDELTRRPLEGVEVRVSGLDVVVQSDAGGQFVLQDLPLGTYEMAMEVDGYRSVSGPLQVLREGSFTVAMSPVGGVARGESGRVAGQVRERENGGPLEGVEVTAEETRLLQITNDRGRFVFPAVAPGQYTLTFHRLGYADRARQITVEADQILTLDVRMGVEPIELEPISVTVEGKSLALELAGFYDRRDASPGFFISREQIEERMPVNTTDLFEGLPGVKVIREFITRRVVLTGSRAVSFIQQPDDCNPAVWLDGQLVHHAGPGDTAWVDRIIGPGEIAGVEVYHRASRIPVQYNVGGACGVIVFWTR
ncbi:MAG: carboxypeptidase regulatory-like domain-containing protein [Gemmatimonadetes bacterium]|nr:carboxypeptidase regulatory-like domain-containing protein [Gemmatimonadota bacterium]